MSEPCNPTTPLQVGRIDLGPTEPRRLTQTEQRVMDAALRRSLKILPDPELLRLKQLLVKVVMPLEVIRMSGWDRHFTQELRDAIEAAIMEIREALKSDG